MGRWFVSHQDRQVQIKTQKFPGLGSAHSVRLLLSLNMIRPPQMT